MIYVDNFYLRCEYRGMRMSHLFSYHQDALHEFAARLGLRREWFHRDHYDISYGKRELAIMRGAHAVRYQDMAKMVRLYRQGQGAVMIPRRMTR